MLKDPWNVCCFLGVNVHSTEVLWDQELKRKSPCPKRTQFYRGTLTCTKIRSVIPAGMAGTWGVLKTQKRDTCWWNQGMCHGGAEPKIKWELISSGLGSPIPARLSMAHGIHRLTLSCDMPTFLISQIAAKTQTKWNFFFLNTHRMGGFHLFWLHHASRRILVP